MPEEARDHRGQLMFSVNEQNALAMLCQVMSHQAYRHKRGIELLPVTALEETTLRVLDGCGKNVNWADMYDRFHRRGANR